jgi:digalactosyldiacylglycerol synthase
MRARAVCQILDEPEHLNWYHHGAQWTDVYKHVVGVVHTNYGYYSRYEERSGGAGDIPPRVRELIMTSLNALVCRAHVDVTVRLSGALPTMPPDGGVVCNVHGVYCARLASHPSPTPSNRIQPHPIASHPIASQVRSDFLAIGASAAELDDVARHDAFDGGAYLLGKALWTKGYRHRTPSLTTPWADMQRCAVGASALGPSHTDGNHHARIPHPADPEANGRRRRRRR